MPALITSIVVVPNQFASSILDWPVWELQQFGSEVEDRESLRHQLGGGRALLYAKVPVDDVAASNLLARNGWQLVDTSVQLEKNFSLPYDFRRSKVRFRLALPRDEEPVATIARTSFSCSRWHRDALIESARADALKEAWVRNFWRGQRGTHMVVAEIDGALVGFHQIVKQESVLLVDLIAVDAEYRGRDIGTGLLAYAERHCGSLAKMLVGTQLSNRASLKMYQRRGFHIVRASHTWHYHLPSGTSAGMVETDAH